MKTSPSRTTEPAHPSLSQTRPSIQGKGITPPAFSVIAAPPAVQKTEKEEETGKETSLQAKFQTDKERKPRTRLKIGQPNDKFEQEADAVAKKAINTSDESLNTVQQKPMDFSGAQSGTSMKGGPALFQAPPSSPPSLQPKIQRFAAENEVEEVKESDSEGFQLKTKAGPVAPPDATDPSTSGAGSFNLDSSLASSKGGGASLSQETQNFMNPRIGADFSGVKVHTGETAVQMNQQLGSKAFAHGKDVYFNKGQYNPGTTGGKELLAHELTHTVQQGGSPVKTKKEIGETGQPQIQQKTTSGTIQKREMNLHEGGADPEVDKARKKSSILRTLAGWAKAIPGYTLMTYVIGREPILGEKVQRNGTNLVGGIMGIVPGGNALFEKLQESGALDKAYSWVSANLFQSNLTWSRIYGELTTFYDSLSWTDALSPGSVWKRVKKIISNFYSDVKTFSGKAGKKIMKITFVGFAGAGGAAVISWLMKLGKNVFKIFKNPILFFKHLGGAVKGGVNGFMAKIGSHLKNGFMEWLMGAMKGTGIELPQKWDLRSTFKFLLDVAGITYDKIRERLVKRFGEKTIARAEKTVDFFKRFMKEGPIVMWKYLKEKAFAIKETLMNAVKDWALGAIIKAGVKNLLTMLVPAGVFGKAIQFMIKFVKWILDNKDKIKSIVESIFQSLDDIVLGNTKAGAGLIESALAKSVPALMDMLAKLLGITGLSQAVQSTVKGLKAKLDGGMDKAFNWLEGKLEKWSGVKPKNVDDTKDTQESKDVKARAAKMLYTELGGDINSPKEAKKTVRKVYEKFSKKGLKEIGFFPVAKDRIGFGIMAKASPMQKFNIKGLPFKFQDEKEYNKIMNRLMYQLNNQSSATYLFASKTTYNQGQPVESFIRKWAFRSQDGVHAENIFFNSKEYAQFKAQMIYTSKGPKGELPKLILTLNRAPCGETHTKHQNFLKGDGKKGCCTNTVNEERAANKHLFDLEVNASGPYQEDGKLGDTGKQDSLLETFKLINNGVQINAGTFWDHVVNDFIGKKEFGERENLNIEGQKALAALVKLAKKLEQQGKTIEEVRKLCSHSK